MIEEGELDRAVAYVHNVSKTFEDKIETYKAFLDVMTSFRNDRIGILEVVAKVMRLFEGHQELISEFVTFLPDPENIVGYQKIMNLSRRRIQPLGEGRGRNKKEGFFEAFAYVHSVWETYPHNKEILKALHDVLTDYQEKRIGKVDVLPRIEDLFQDHEELVLGFKNFSI
ncbi:paired amphipathic helix protein Sin3-like 5 [Tripterygium wilfordii]|uniref:paired amphipathic helix protein Sin3-like 5 n=1 Tax=Tripterygium wilfordii TaxID=458696 RepID=UPI0018F81270|nr:paired amphipathic helix protein Sin3-like 5 [Tripterygium wilfordii]